MGIKKLDATDKDFVNEFIMKYEELGTQRALAKYYHLDRHTVGKFLKEIKYDNIHKSPIDKEIVQKVIDMYDSYPSAEVAQILGISESAVGGIWYRNGLIGKTNRKYHLTNEDYFKTINHNSAYWLGFIGADGCIGTTKDNRQDMLTIRLQKNDYKILEVLSKELGTNKPITFEKRKEGHVYSSIQISSNVICNDLRNLGLGNNKTYDNSIANIEDKYMFDLIRGYIDGDGSISQKRECISISGYKTNLFKIKDFCEQFGIYSTFIEDKRHYNENNFHDQFGSLSFNNKTEVYCLCKMIYKNCNDCFLERKKFVADDIINKIETSDKPSDKQILLYYNYVVNFLFNSKIKK